jgi:hypothetical protein
VALISRVAASQAPAVVTQAPIDPSLDITFHALLLPREIYVGQQASYQVGVFIAEDARARLRRNPEFVPPELRAMLGYDLASPSSFSRIAGGRRYEVHVFQRAIFPLVAGRHAIAPARLSYSLPLSTSFFSREESRTLRAESLSVIARDPPVGPETPSDYAGAVGSLTVDRRIDSNTTRVGTPFVLTVAVRGVGNVALLPRPALRLTWAQLVQGPERVQIDTTGTYVRGVKEFDYIVTPTATGTHSVPAIRYPYFDPYSARYAIALAPELAVSVERGTLIATSTAVGSTPQPLSIRRAYRGALSEPVSSRATFWLAMAIFPLPAAGLALVRRSRTRRVRRTSHALQQLAANGVMHDGAAVRRALTAALSSRLQIDAATLADPQRIVRALRRRGVTRETAQQAAQIHAELDAAVFGGASQVADASLHKRAASIFAAIDREATRRYLPLGKLGTGATLLFIATTSIARAVQEPSVDLQAFQHGVSLYNAGAYGSAQRIFSALATAEPRAVDAWVNAGASAWQAHDTAAAAVAWHRALRLEPLDQETRERLDFMPSFQRGFFGDVPPIPLSLVVWIGASAWLVVWILQPLRRRWARNGAIAAFAVAAVAMVAGLRLNEIFRGRQTAVVTSAERLRSGPSLGAELAEAVMVGETVRTPTARTTWTLVRLRDGREGWLPTERLVSLELRN